MEEALQMVFDKVRHLPLEQIRQGACVALSRDEIAQIQRALLENHLEETTHVPDTPKTQEEMK